MPSIRERISQARQALFGRETRNVPIAYEGMYSSWGTPQLYDSAGALATRALGKTWHRNIAHTTCLFVLVDVKQARKRAKR